MACIVSLRSIARLAPAARAALAASAASFVIAACSGDGGGEPTASACKQGATRTCLGPGACSGAQSCGADGTWSACDCGGSGGVGGIGGGAGSGTGGTAGSDGSAGSGGGTQWKDDPCPTDTPLIDCSTSCGGPSANCAQATCGFVEHGVASPLWPVVIRTPSKPGFDPKCTALCPGTGLAFGIGLLQGLVSINTWMGLRVTVPKPWSVRLSSHSQLEEKDFCTVEQPPAQCAVWPDNAATVLLLTTDPNAPAVNAILEEVPWNATCP